MVGNMQDAQKIYKRRRSYKGIDVDGHVGGGPLPAGWKKIGEGSFRSCYLSPDGVVYKVCYDYFTIDNGPNENDNEYLNWYRIKSQKKRVPGWKIPDVSIYSWFEGNKHISVVAMEYVQGTHEIFDDDEECAGDWGMSEFGIEDRHEGNYIVSGKTRYLVDLSF